MDIEKGFKPKIIKGESEDNKELEAEECFALERKEKYNFTENDIIEQIKKLISENGFSMNDLKVRNIIKDNSGNILYLKAEVKVTTGDKIERVEYEFMIEGEYSSVSGDYVSDKTEIVKIKSDIPEIVAVYEDGEWEYINKTK